jgi:diguanylate cyclase (GGDEF)-like protein
MQFDFQTIMVVDILVNAFVAVCLIAYGALQKTAPGFRHWISGYVLFAMTWLPLLLRAHMPFLLSTCLVIIGFAYVALINLDGVRRFLGRGPLKRIYYFTPALLCPVIIYYTIAQDNMAIRNLVMSSFITMVELRIAYLFWKHSSSDNRALYLLAGPVARGFFSIHIIWWAIVMLIDMPQRFQDATTQVNFTIVLSMFFHYAFATIWFMLNNNWAETNLKEANKKLEQMSYIDGLTQIANRRYFNERLEIEFKRAARSNLSLTLVLMDIDHFKLYNDHYGHLEGDNCLRLVAKVIKSNCKRAGDLAARYGGEEFGILIFNDGVDSAEHICTAIRRDLKKLAISHEKSLTSDLVTLSMGIASMVPDADGSSSSLINAADQALYHAKNDGRDCLHINRSAA